MSSKYTIEELDWAISHLLPWLPTLEERGIVIGRPELIKMIAWDAFLGKYSPHNANTSEKYPKYPRAMYLVQMAAHDLSEHGYFKGWQTTDEETTNVR